MNFENILDDSWISIKENHETDTQIACEDAILDVNKQLLSKNKHFHALLSGQIKQSHLTETGEVLLHIVDWIQFGRKPIWVVHTGHNKGWETLQDIYIWFMLRCSQDAEFCKWIYGRILPHENAICDRKAIARCWVEMCDGFRHQETYTAVIRETELLEIELAQCSDVKKCAFEQFKLIAQVAQAAKKYELSDLYNSLLLELEHRKNLPAYKNVLN